MEQLNISAIKKEARAFIDTDRRWLTMGLACLPVIFLTSALEGGSTVAQCFSENQDNVSVSISFGGGILFWLSIPFMIAMAGYFLNYLRGVNPHWKTLYHEGIDNYGKYFKVGVITELIIALWTLLLIIPGIIKSYEYYFVHQIIHDNPNLDHKQARDLSRRMTDGYKSDLFVLDISFFLWYLLVIITFGIASVYVIPYINCTKAMCYENLKHNALVNGFATPDEFGIYPVSQENIDENTTFTNNTDTVDYNPPVAEEPAPDDDINE